MKKIIVTIMFVLVFSAPASAHVLISDTSRQVGAVLHITPDDDPVAGEPSGLFFDIQSTDISRDNYSFSLTVTNADGQQTPVPITVNGTTVSASYVFPYQDAYTVTLKADPVDTTKESLYFEQAQRVSRGTVNDDSFALTYSWAEIGVVVSGCGLLVIIVIGYNKRKEIHTYAKTHY